MKCSGRAAHTLPFLVMLTAVGVSAARAAERPSAHTHTVTIEALQFQPAELIVHRRDRIVWTNKDPFPHTVTAASKLFDSRSLGAEGSWTYVASRRGEFPYGCTLHPTMKGKIVVQ